MHYIQVGSKLVNLQKTATVELRDLEQSGTGFTRSIVFTSTSGETIHTVVGEDKEEVSERANKKFMSIYNELKRYQSGNLKEI